MPLVFYAVLLGEGPMKKHYNIRLVSGKEILNNKLVGVSRFASHKKRIRVHTPDGKFVSVLPLPHFVDYIHHQCNYEFIEDEDLANEMAALIKSFSGAK